MYRDTDRKFRWKGESRTESERASAPRRSPERDRQRPGGPSAFRRGLAFADPKKQFAAIKLELITPYRLGDLVAEGFDRAIRFGEPRPSTLVARKLLDTRIVTVASPAYLKKAGPCIPPN
jgi:DNA-binding transcriptional LysR family regulator